MKRIEIRLVKHLQQKGLTLALAESVTCGMIAEKLNTVQGTADVFMGSLVCYHPYTKIHTLKIPKNLINKCSCESQEVTSAMAKNLGRLFNADIYAAITGLSAPGGSESKGKPVGTIFISVIFKKKLKRERYLFRGTPAEIKKKACKALLQLVLKLSQKG